MSISSSIDKIKDYAIKFGLSILIAAICLIPTWIYLVARFVFEPDNALVEIILFGVALYFLGAIQLILFVVGVYLILSLVIMD